MDRETKASGYLLRFGFVPLLGILAYVGVARLLERLLGLGHAPVGSFAGLLLALAPAVLWLAYFYALDRRQPEPTHYVFSMFLLGALVAAPLARWILDGLLGMQQWAALSTFSWPNIALAFLAVGAAQETAKYIVVRYSVYLADAFDERADGIVYATAVGLGFAVALNCGLVIEGTLLTRGALEITVGTLAQACFSGAMGYGLGHARFAGRRAQLYQALGLLVAIALNGLFYLLHAWVMRPSLALHPWRGLLFSALFTGAVFAVILLLMRRSLREDETLGAPPARPTAPLAGGLLDIVRRADFLVVALAVVLLAAGWVTKNRHLDRSTRYQQSGVSLRYPAGWLALPGLGNDQQLTNIMASDVFKPAITVGERPRPPALTADEIERHFQRWLAGERTLFHLIGSRGRRLGAQRAVRLDYACAVNPASRPGWPSLVTDIPVTVRGALLGWLAGGKLHHVLVEQSESHRRLYPHLADQVLGSVKVGP